MAEEGDVECGGDVEDVVRDHHLRACDEFKKKGCLQVGLRELPPIPLGQEAGFTKPRGIPKPGSVKKHLTCSLSPRAHLRLFVRMRTNPEVPKEIQLDRLVFFAIASRDF